MIARMTQSGRRSARFTILSSRSQSSTSFSQVCIRAPPGSSFSTSLIYTDPATERLKGNAQMNIDVLYVEGCPNYAAALTMAREAAAELGVNADIQEVLVRGPEEARAMHFLGSPSIQVNFEDIEPGAGERTDFAYAARSYGGAPLPPRAMLVAAIARAAGLEPNEETKSGAGSEEGPAEHTPARAPGEARIIPTPICPGCLSALVRLGMQTHRRGAQLSGPRVLLLLPRLRGRVRARCRALPAGLKDLIVCPVCLGERYLRSAGLAVVGGVSYYTCRSPDARPTWRKRRVLHEAARRNGQKPGRARSRRHAAGVTDHSPSPGFD